LRFDRFVKLNHNLFDVFFHHDDLHFALLHHV
jgi:hypothetical protein